MTVEKKDDYGGGEYWGTSLVSEGLLQAQQTVNDARSQRRDARKFAITGTDGKTRGPTGLYVIAVALVSLLLLLEHCGVNAMMGVR